MAHVLQHSDWLDGGVPDSVRQRIRETVASMGRLPYPQPFGVISGDGVMLAGNRSLLDLLGISEHELLEAEWEDYMPGWSDEAAWMETATPPQPFVFERDLLTAVRQLWIRAIACPLTARATDSAAAFGPAGVCQKASGGDRQGVPPGSGRQETLGSGRQKVLGGGRQKALGGGDEALAAWLLFILDQLPAAPSRASGAFADSLRLF